VSSPTPATLIVTWSPGLSGPIPDGVPGRVIHQPVRGYGEALRTGFRVAAGQWVLTLDADTIDAEHIADAARKLVRAAALR